MGDLGSQFASVSNCVYVLHCRTEVLRLITRVRNKCLSTARL